MRAQGHLSGSIAMPTEQLVSVVLPCLNEARAVGGCVERALTAIGRMGLRGEVLVVDNGSSDDSPRVAAAAGARVLAEPRRGYGVACRRGLDEAKGSAIVLADADGTYDLAEIPRFVEPLDANGSSTGYEFVMGTRLRGKILPAAMPWSHRWIGNPLLSTMVKILFRTQVSDSQCGMRSISRVAYQQIDLRSTGFELASEMVIRAIRARLRIHEVPITYHPRVGTSKLLPLRDAWRHIRLIARESLARPSSTLSGRAHGGVS